MVTCRDLLPSMFLALIMLGHPTKSADGHRQNVLTLNQMIDQICITDGVEPAYLVGKAFAALLGPAVMHADVNEDIPFLEETRTHRTYAQIHPLDRDSCRTVLEALHGQVSTTVRHKRLLKLRECVQETIGRNVSRAGSNERWAWHVLDEVVSEMALSLDYDEALICTAFSKRKIAVAFIRSLGGWLEEEEVEDRGEQAWMTCSRERAKEGACFAGSAEEDLRNIPGRMRGAMQAALGGCSHVAWWLCRGASSVEQRLHGDTLAGHVMVAAARFLGVMHEQVRWQGRHVINEAFRYVLGRDADEAGYGQYTRLVAIGEGPEQIEALLMQSHEYLEYSREMGFHQLGEQVRAIFLDILLRQPEPEALQAYSMTLQQPNGVDKMRKILMDSAEFRELCRRRDRASCEEARGAVRRVFTAVMGRPPDNEGLASYTREIVLGHLSLDGMRALLRGSDEYLFGVRLKLRARRLAAHVQAMHPHCRRPDAAPDAFGAGRWCQRGACEHDSGEPCAHWPLTAYRQVQAVTWGQATLDEVAGAEGTEEWEGSGAAGRVARYSEQHAWLVGMYERVLGRFPSAAELVQGLGRLSNGTATSAELEAELEAERAQAGEEEEEAAEVWGVRVEAMANLLESVGEALPGAAAGCFGRGHVLPELATSLFCLRIHGHLLFDIAQPPPPDHPECLSGRASWTVCSEGRWLCRPTPGVRPLPALVEVANRAEHRGMPGLQPSWVFFAAGAPDAAGEGQGVCGERARVLVALQEHWNERAPLFNPRPAGAGPATEVPVAMYVHERPHYFREVLAHLRRVRGVGGVPVLVVSMDAVHPDMLAIARAIDFVPVRILFHPGRTDGRRVQSVLAIKAHWAWLQDMLWTRLPETRGYHGHIALLEEDHVVTPDYLEVLSLLLRLKAAHCPRCWGVCVKFGCRDMADREAFKVCRSHAVINTGIAFNRSTYHAIRASDFAGFADGWDWSLFHLAQTGQMGDAMLAPAVSRIRNIGVEGATVRDEAGDDFLLHQLDYKDVGAHAAFQPDRFWVDAAVGMHYVPPAWEPLFLGALGFIAT